MALITLLVPTLAKYFIEDVGVLYRACRRFEASTTDAATRREYILGTMFGNDLSLLKTMGDRYDPGDLTALASLKRYVSVRS